MGGITSHFPTLFAERWPGCDGLRIFPFYIWVVFCLSIIGRNGLHVSLLLCVFMLTAYMALGIPLLEHNIAGRVGGPLAAGTPLHSFGDYFKVSSLWPIAWLSTQYLK
jgi:hypothetical protein